MRKADIVKKVSDAANIGREQAQSAVDQVIDAMTASLTHGERFKLQGRSVLTEEDGRQIILISYSPSAFEDPSAVLEVITQEPSVRALAATIEVFGDLEKAKTFLSTAHPQFENRPPIEIALDNEKGMSRLIGFLNEIKFGLPA